ncbi:MAG TPA: leucine--tRNA ligase, partial [Peptococcaceae bacterium]|nr:leucine--tRNA ligase [Peptococcaceae bacterium]
AKMSKSKGNVVSPEDIMARYGADTSRLFILFAAPPERDLEWSDQGVEGCYRFLQRVWRLVNAVADEVKDAPAVPTKTTGVNLEMRRLAHRTVYRVTRDIEERFGFNTAISAIMELVNGMYQFIDRVPPVDRDPAVTKEAIEKLLLLLAPFAPFIAEELWERTGHAESIHKQPWPAYEEALLQEEHVTIVVQINGRVRDRMVVPADLAPEDMQQAVLEQPRVQKLIAGKKIVKIVPVPKKLVNIVVR